MESYLTPILLSYVEKYVLNINPADVQVSLWGGGVTLHNLVLKPDVLQREVALPFRLVSGRINELIISVPWTKIISEPIVVSINTIECVLSLNTNEEEAPLEQPRNQLIPSPPVYMKSLIWRIINNISVSVHSLILKYVQEDLVVSLNVKWLNINSADVDFNPAFADIDAECPVVRRLVRVDDFTLCLDRSEADGRIRHYQEPLLDRCQLTIKVATKLVSLQSRKAKNLTVEIRSGNLELGVTSDQLLLLVRLMRARPAPEPRRRPLQPPPDPTLNAGASCSSGEAPQVQTWAQWAWSWLPTWSDARDVDQEPSLDGSFPILISAFVDKVALIFKIMETDAGSNRRRARPLLELSAAMAAASYLAMGPVHVRLRAAVRAARLASRGKCVCGHVSLDALHDRPTIYLATENTLDSDWTWPEEILSQYNVESALEAEFQDERQEPFYFEEHGRQADRPQQPRRWLGLSPALFAELVRDRHPPDDVDAYDNPPQDFEYSDWHEIGLVRVVAWPMTLDVSTGLLHRANAIRELLKEVPPAPEPELVVRPLTVEECEALSEVIPDWSISATIKSGTLRFTPWDHNLNEQPAEPTATFELSVTDVNAEITAPMYPRRLCMAACQITDEANAMRKAAYLKATAFVHEFKGYLSTPNKRLNRPIFSGIALFSWTDLYYKQLFTAVDPNYSTYNINTENVIFYLTPAAYKTIVELLHSLFTDRASVSLRETTLADDAANEQDTTAIEATIPQVTGDLFIAENVKMLIALVSGIKTTAVELKDGVEGNIGWVCSAPDIRGGPKPWIVLRMQLCEDCTRPDALDYVSVETNSMALSLDSLLVRWLTYRPRLRIAKSSSRSSSGKLTSSSKNILRRRPTPTQTASASASERGRGGAGSAAQFVHGRARSAGSLTERRDPPPGQPPNAEPQRPQERRWDNAKFLALYERLRRTLVDVRADHVVLYHTASTASALETNNVHEAMERHANEMHRVLIITLGKWQVTTAAQNFWQHVSDTGPTKLPQNLRLEQTFPWKLRVTGANCCTLQETQPTDLNAQQWREVRQNERIVTLIRPEPKSLIDPFTSTVIVSVVTRSADRAPADSAPPADRPRPPQTEDDQKEKFFTAGMDYKPTTIGEFLRGPKSRPGTQSGNSDQGSSPPDPDRGHRADGPLTCLGVNIHGETAPVVVTLTQDQIHTIRAAIHGFAHIAALLKRRNMPIPPPRRRGDGPSSAGTCRAGSSDSQTVSESVSEPLISIYEPRAVQDAASSFKTLVWIQWIVNRALMSFGNTEDRLTLQLEDCIATADLQAAYEKYRFKIASAKLCSFRHVISHLGERMCENGVFGGRVMETREAADGKVVNFFSGTITIPHPSNLPPNWREEYMARPTRDGQRRDTVWEVSVTMAPLELMLHPRTLSTLTLITQAMLLPSFCPVVLEQSVNQRPMPLCHMDLGGFKVTIAVDESDDSTDDTFIVNIGQIITRPYPPNPICRRSINTMGEANWLPAASGSEGRQHEITIKAVSVHTARMSQLLAQMRVIRSRNQRAVNPAANWAEPVPTVTLLPILHNVDVMGVFAPPIMSDASLVCGPALELTVVDDVSLELSSEQLSLLARTIPAFVRAATERLNVFYEEVEEAQAPLDESAGVSDSGLASMPGASSSEPVLEPRRSDCMVSVTPPLGQWEHVEVFMVMGRIDCNFYIRSTHPYYGKALRPRPQTPQDEEEPIAVPNVTVVIKAAADTGVKDRESDMPVRSRSLTETARAADLGRSHLEIVERIQFARRASTFISILHATLHQPNMYYWRKRDIKGLQMSLYDLKMVHGEGNDARYWHLPLLSTRAGAADPYTEIPPSLASLNCVTLPVCAGAAAEPARDCWSVKLDIERPIIAELSCESLRRILIIPSLIRESFSTDQDDSDETESDTPLLSRLYAFMSDKGVQQFTVNVGQVVACLPNARVSWVSVRAQVARARRPSRLCARALLEALACVVTKDEQRPRLALRPLTVGVQAEASWESWHAAELGTACAPFVRLLVELSDINIDLCPADVLTLMCIYSNIMETLDDTDDGENVDLMLCRIMEDVYATPTPLPEYDSSGDVYYKDDLRSGVFKIVCGDEPRMPMVYEVAVQGAAVVWHYPIPRSITRIVADPLPDCNTEVDCILESYNCLLDRWEANAYFAIPVAQSREYIVSKTHSDKIFANLWRVRPTTYYEEREPFKFNHEKYLPQDVLVVQWGRAACATARECVAGAPTLGAQLAGALRVDSFSAVRATPRLVAAARCAAAAIHLHTAEIIYDTDDLSNPDMVPDLEGLYQKPDQRDEHRALSLVAREAAVNAARAPCSWIAAYDGTFGVDVFDSETGTMEPLVDEVPVRAAAARAARRWVRVAAGDVRVDATLARVRTLHLLNADWLEVYTLYVENEQLVQYSVEDDGVNWLAVAERHEWGIEQRRMELARDSLDGHVHLYVVNTTNVRLYVGQQATEEATPLAPHNTLAYKWFAPRAAKKLRFARTTNGSPRLWSTSVRFKEDTSFTIMLPHEEASGAARRDDDIHLHIRIEDSGTKKIMYLSGKILLGNMLNETLAYKVVDRDQRYSNADGLRVRANGLLKNQSVGDTLLLSNNLTDTYIKIKFTRQNSGWSGDIPLKRCPKPCVPWLVKVPSTGPVPCLSVWCRVEQTPADNRISVIFYPMYVMRSHLPYDVLLTMTTVVSDWDGEAPAPLVQHVPGRGQYTQLLSHGTTTARHALTMKHAEATFDVLDEPAPLHYGMSKKNVFKKHDQPNTTEETAAHARKWLSQMCNRRDNEWPYTPVRNHFRGMWQTGLVKPGHEVQVSYESVACGSNGCGMLAEVRPAALFANACVLPVALVGADGSRLCWVLPGVVVVPPACILTEPFYLALYTPSEKYVSNMLQVSARDPGVYGKLGPGEISPDRYTSVVVSCSDRVSFMSIHYTICNEIYVFGITNAFAVLNRLPFSILMAPVVIKQCPRNPPILRPTECTIVHAAEDDMRNAVVVSNFIVGRQWKNSDIDSLCTYMCFGVPNLPNNGPVAPFVPVRVGVPPLRRGIGLTKYSLQSVPVVVSQLRHEGRWVVMLSLDPSPQYLVRNLTAEPLALGQPLRYKAGAEPPDGIVPVLRECISCKWCFSLEPTRHSYYSTITHLMRTMPANRGAAKPQSQLPPYLTVGRLIGEYTPEWGCPFAVMDGEQILQLPRHLNIKVRVKVHPHSTVVDLLPVGQGDLSALAIRNRLVNNVLPPKPEIPPKTELSGDNRPCEALEVAQKCKLMQRDSDVEYEKGESSTAPSENIPESEEKAPEAPGPVTIAQMDYESETSLWQPEDESDANASGGHGAWLRVVAGSVAVSLARSCDDAPIVRAAFERVALRVADDGQTRHTMISIGDMQIDNKQFSSRQYDFPVVASTSAEPRPQERQPAMYSLLLADEYFDLRPRHSFLVLGIAQALWTVEGPEYTTERSYGCLRHHSEVVAIDVYAGPLALWLEDAYVTCAAAALAACAPRRPPADAHGRTALDALWQLTRPLRVHRLHVHPLQLTVTLHTVMQLYIGLYRSPLRLNSFRLEHAVTTPDTLTHNLTVHYLSGVLMGAGWVVGGLEVLGAPGSLAAGLAATPGGLRGVAAAAAAAALRSVSTCAGSWARNLDLLAGDDEHTRRAAVARRDIPPTLLSGLVVGMQNFALNLLGAVAGIAHHPVVGLGVGESTGVQALRRSLVGAFAKPLSATADLVAYAGQGLLSQTGWDPDPKQRPTEPRTQLATPRADAVRWSQRLRPLCVLYAANATLAGEDALVLVTDKFIVVAEPTTERIREMIDCRFCTLVSYTEDEVEILIKQADQGNESRDSGQDEHRASSAAMARVARYMGAGGAGAGEGRTLVVRAPRAGAALAAAIAAALLRDPAACHVLL